jgi:ornithine cyclodeaminase/alanine dehydrogenase
MDTQKTLMLSQEDVAKCILPENFINIVDNVFIEWGNDNVVMPSKINLDMSKSGFDSWSNAMPAYVTSYDAAGIKWIGGYKNNLQQGLPYIRGIVILTDPETGRTLSVMDGTYISDWRTGASAAVAAKYLARNNCGEIAMIGAGKQAETATKCIYELFPEATFTAVDISSEKLELFKQKMDEDFQIKVNTTTNAEAAVANADVVVMLTTAKQPFIKRERLKKGSLVLAMGSYQQAENELILEADKIIVDSWGQAAHRGELKKLVETGLLDQKDIYSELGVIAAGLKQGRENQDENILAVLVGLGAHDVLASSLVYKAAREKNLGQLIFIN